MLSRLQSILIHPLHHALPALFVSLTDDAAHERILLVFAFLRAIVADQAVLLDLPSFWRHDSDRKARLVVEVVEWCRKGVWTSRVRQRGDGRRDEAQPREWVR